MSHNTKKVTIALKKANSLMKKINSMIENKSYCIDVIQQNLAVIGLLRSANLALLDGHINHCIKNAAKEKDTEKLDKMMSELLRVMEVAQKK